MLKDKKMKQLLVYFSIILLNISCESSNDVSFLIGKWKYFDNFTIEFNENKEFKWVYSNGLELNGKFEINYKKNTLILTYENEFESNFTYHFVDNQLIIYQNKDTKGKLKHHIDEIIILKNYETADNLKFYSSTEYGNDLFILPNDFNGIVYVNYNNPLANNAAFDENNNRVIDIPENGLSKTSFIENPMKYALGQMIFTKKNNSKIPFFIGHMLMGLNRNEITYMGLNYDSTYVCLLGFNQDCRENINNEYSCKISGNVLMFRIDKLKNILESFETSK
jgi:hypothetical protein